MKLFSFKHLLNLSKEGKLKNLKIACKINSLFLLYE